MVVSKSFKTLGGSMSNHKFNYNYHELRKLIVFKYGNLKTFCTEVLNITPTHFSNIMSGRAEYSQSFITKTVNALDIMPSDIGLYFFTQECQKVSK